MGNSNGRPRPHGWRIGNHGYRVLWAPEHECADVHGYVLEHIAVASAVLGHRLPERAQVHHVNGDKTDNRGENLVICDSRAHHMLIHQRQQALRECGHADWRKCVRCHAYDDPQELIRHGARAVVHRECQQSYQRQRYHNNRQRTTA